MSISHIYRWNWKFKFFNFFKNELGNFLSKKKKRISPEAKLTTPAKRVCPVQWTKLWNKIVENIVHKLPCNIQFLRVVNWFSLGHRIDKAICYSFLSDVILVQRCLKGQYQLMKVKLNYHLSSKTVLTKSESRPTGPQA